MLYAVAAAKSRNSTPDAMLIVFSLTCLDASAPPSTAMPVAMACPTIAPEATPTGFWAAPSAMVASMDLSPHSAMKMRVAVSKNALSGDPLRTLPLCSASLTASSASAISSSAPPPASPSSAFSPSLSARMPKKMSSAMPASSPTGTLDLRASGTLEKTAPMATLMTVMMESEVSDPANEIHLPSFMASRAAMKNVLSPISDRKMSENAARKPLLPSGPLTSTSLMNAPWGVAMAAAVPKIRVRRPPSNSQVPLLLGELLLSDG
mmetsp:Transcript_27571/g.70240  ORF Transcript_27571/g.70240 Transcript_27571/m.70240 type:complete len:264 (-) Transcript_27571:390-1181(-)